MLIGGRVVIKWMQGTVGIDTFSLEICLNLCNMNKARFLKKLMAFVLVGIIPLKLLLITMSTQTTTPSKILFDDINDAI